MVEPCEEGNVPLTYPRFSGARSLRRDLSKTALFGIGTLLVVEQSSLESQSRGCAKTPILMVFILMLLPLQ